MRSLPATLPNIAIQSSGAGSWRNYVSTHPNVDIGNWNGYWDVSPGSGNTIENGGTTAPVATNAGLVKVTGPAIWFNGVKPAVGASQNRIAKSNGVALGVDAPFDCRYDCTISASPVAGMRFVDSGFLAQFNSLGAISFLFYGEDGSFPTVTATLAQIQAVFPGINIGSRLQFRHQWDNVSDTQSCWVRLPGPNLREDAGWILVSSVVQAGKSIRYTNILGYNIGNLTPSSVAYDGLFYGWYYKVNNEVIWEVTPSIIGALAPEAASFNDVNGVATFVSRETTSVSTVIVPSGTVYINPDDTNAANQITIADDNLPRKHAAWKFEFKQGNTLSCPLAESACNIPGDFEIVCRLNPKVLNNNLFGTGYGPAWGVYYSVAGSLSIGLKFVGQAVTFSGFGAYTGTAGVPFWFKITRNKTTGDLILYTAPDSETEPTSWTLRQTLVGVGTGLDIDYVGSTDFVVGDGRKIPTAIPFNGNIYRVIVRNGIGGPTVMDTGDVEIPENKPANYVCKTGQLMTINGNVPIVTKQAPTFDIDNYWAAWKFSGNAAHFLSTPDAAALDIVGDIEFVARISNDTLPTFALPETIISKRGDVGQYSFQLRYESTGRLGLVWSTDGTANSTMLSTVPIPFANGVPHWLKVTLDVDNGAGGNDTKVYTAPNSETEPTVWTQLGTTVTQAGITSIFNSTTPVAIGRGPTGGHEWRGKIYRTILRNGIGGTTVFDSGDFEIPESNPASYVCKTGQTVTINGSVPVIPRVGDDAVMMWTGQLGNPKPLYPVIFGTSNGTTQTFRILKITDVSQFYGQIAFSIAAVDSVFATVAPEDNMIVVFAIVDRKMRQLKIRYFYNGILRDTAVSVDIARQHEYRPFNQQLLMSGIPGTVKSFAFNKGNGVAPTDQELTALAKQLIIGVRPTQRPV